MGANIRTEDEGGEDQEAKDKEEPCDTCGSGLAERGGGGLRGGHREAPGPARLLVLLIFCVYFVTILH